MPVRAGIKQRHLDQTLQGSIPLCQGGRQLLPHPRVCIAVGLSRAGGLEWASGLPESTQTNEKPAANFSSCFPHFLFVSQDDKNQSPAYPAAWLETSGSGVKKT